MSVANGGIPWQNSGINVFGAVIVMIGVNMKITLTLVMEGFKLGALRAEAARKML
jgi:hypothetical protein